MKAHIAALDEKRILQAELDGASASASLPFYFFPSFARAWARGRRLPRERVTL